MIITETVTKKCKKCEREHPLNTDYYFKNKERPDGHVENCKECSGFKFTKYHSLKDGEMICKKCERVLPYDVEHFPQDKTTKTGLRNVCYECKGSHFGKRKEKAKNWTKEEDELLKKVYSDNLNKDILHLFPTRTDRALMDRASNLGIYKSQEAVEKRYDAHSEYMYQNSAWIGVPKTENHKEHLSTLMKDRWKKSPEEMLLVTQYERDANHRQYLSSIRTEAGMWKGENNPRFINPLRGSDNGRWLGGITPLLFWFRNQLSDWKKESMEFHNYKCILTGENFDEIHHLYSFNSIIEETLNQINFNYTKTLENFTEEELEILRSLILENNNKYGLGICLKKDVHKLFHDLYGYGNNTPEQFKEFEERFNSGEFKDI